MNTTLRMLLLCAALVALSACDDPGKKTDGAGSETHFLAGCSQTCEQGFDCICGVCTQRCTDDTQCESLGAECYSSVALAVGNACSEPPQMPVSVCHSECTADADCARLGSNHTCQGGFCVQPPPAPPGDVTDDTDEPDDGDTAAPTDTSVVDIGLDGGDDTAQVCVQTPPACDGLDNDCDGQIDEGTIEFELPDAPLLPLVDGAQWSMATLGGQVYTAVTSPTADDHINVVEHASGQKLASVLGHSPILFASESGQTLVLFFLAAADNELGQPQEEVHVVAIGATSSAGAPTCLSCADPTRSERGDIINYDVAFSAPDSNLDGLNDPDDTRCEGKECGYVAVYVRSDQKLYSVRATFDTLEVSPNSEGVVLSFMEANFNVYDVDIEIANPSGLAQLSVFRNDHSEDERIVATVLATNRLQIDASERVATGGQMDTERTAMRVFKDGRILAARIVDSGVEVTVLERNEVDKGLDVVGGPATLTPQLGHEPATVWLARTPSEDQYLLAVETVDSTIGEHAVELHEVTVNLDALDIRLAGPPHPGRSPRSPLSTAANLVVGLLASPAGVDKPVTDTLLETTPAMLDRACDAP